MIRGGILRDPAPLSHPNTPPPSAFPRKTRPARHKTPIFGSLEHAGRTFSCSRALLAEQGDKSRVQRTPTRDFETHNTNARPRTATIETNDTSAATDVGQHETTITSARPRTATIETGDTSATEKHAKNTHFSPAKAMAVSTPHGHEGAMVPSVSDNHTHGLRAPAAAPAVIYAPSLRKLARNSIGPTHQRRSETLKYQQTQFKP